ncbi:MAG: 3-demethylubiquinone-9 3-O-methyltransferase [Planctomycetes bacterium]|nr:3-demethylubiquinone-9 3-O-methyltransferase [Planctomycetota bacterium]
MILTAAMKNDLEIYERAAHAWWDGSDRTFRSLQRVKAFHLAELERLFGSELHGASVVDLGCGGGLLSVPLAERGASVIGLDRSPRSVRAARDAAGRAGVSKRCRFGVADLCGSPLEANAFDIALLSDVLEHVSDPGGALREAARLLRLGGRLYLNTFNRTRRARWLAVALAEGLGYVPRGTHDWRLFVRPEELRALAAAVGLRCDEVLGEAPRICATLRAGALEMRRGASTAVSYTAVFTKVEVPA